MKKTITIISVVAIVAILAVTLMACVPSDYSKAESNLKDAGYKGLSYKKGDIGFATATSFLGVEDLEAYMSYGKGEDEYITLAYFSNASAAKKAYDSMKKDYDENVAELKEAGIDTSNYVFKRSGKVIYAGTKQAVKDVQ